MGIFLGLLAWVLLIAGVWVLLSGLLARRRKRPARFGWPVGVGLIVVATVLVNIAAGMLPKPTASEAKPTPPAVEEPQETEEVAEATESEDLAEQPAEAPDVPEVSGKPINVGLFVVKCRNNVKSQLKSPSTAKFPSALESHSAVRDGEDNVRVWQGYVDSQNGFGAMVRTQFVCTYAPATEEVSAAFME